MCGLVGVWRHDGGEADRKLIDLMLTPIAHRGPDGKGIWQHGRVALGHRRLSIIDLTEASGQPMLTRDGMGVLVYNGEVYNFRELRNELEREGITFRTSGDSEVVLNRSTIGEWSRAYSNSTECLPLHSWTAASGYFGWRVTGWASNHYSPPTRVRSSSLPLKQKPFLLILI